jgi:hypothetical protein
MVAGGNYAKDSMPNWYVNLEANPDRAWIDLGRGRMRVVAETLVGADRYPWIRSIPMILGLQGATRREIPVVRLTQPMRPGAEVRA